MILEYLNSLTQDRNGKPSLGRFGYLIAILTSIFWTNVIFFMYVHNAYFGKNMPDMPAQVVMIIVSILGGYLGIKGTETMAVMGNRYGNRNNAGYGNVDSHNGFGVGNNNPTNNPANRTRDTLPISPDRSEMGNAPHGNLPVTGLSKNVEVENDLPHTGA